MFFFPHLSLSLLISCIKLKNSRIIFLKNLAQTLARFKINLFCGTVRFSQLCLFSGFTFLSFLAFLSPTVFQFPITNGSTQVALKCTVLAYQWGCCSISSRLEVHSFYPWGYLGVQIRKHKKQHRSCTGQIYLGLSDHPSEVQNTSY